MVLVTGPLEENGRLVKRETEAQRGERGQLLTRNVEHLGRAGAEGAPWKRGLTHRNRGSGL